MPMCLIKSFCFLFIYLSYSYSQQITIAVASNFIMPMKEITSRFDGSVRLVFGSSGKLYAQIVNGAPYDLFLSADQDKPKNLYDQKYTNYKPFTYAIGRLALYSANPKFFPMNKNTLFNGLSIAIANPALAPYGSASIDVLNNLSRGNKPYSKLIMGENITQVFSFTSSGNTDLGFVALSQVIQKEKKNYWLIPIRYHNPIKQDAIVLKSDANCNRFVKYMKSEDVKLVLKSYGYLWN